MVHHVVVYVARHHVGLLALFVALSGTSYAISAGSISSRDIKNNSIRSKDVRNNEIRSADVRDASLLARDFRAGQLPTGNQGPRGEPGPPGPPGMLSNVRVRHAEVPVLDGNYVESNAPPCDPGEILIGGGARITTTPELTADVFLRGSYPTRQTLEADVEDGGPFDRWRASAFNPAGGTSTATLRIWGLCAK